MVHYKLVRIIIIIIEMMMMMMMIKMVMMMMMMMMMILEIWVRYESCGGTAVVSANPDNLVIQR